MKKIILLITFCIFFIGIFVYILRPTAPLKLNNLDTAKNFTVADNQNVSNVDQSATYSDTNKSEAPLQNKKPKKLSAEASAYYTHALRYGWESVVRDFENGTIPKSKIPQEEKDKLCEIALSYSKVDQTKRLFKANCKPLSDQSSFMIINAKLTNAEGKIDQNEIIEKLKFYKSDNVLQTKVTYKIGLYEEKSTLQSQAIGWGLEDVSDYLLDIGVDYSGVDGNLILANIKGRNPSARLIQKLINAGIQPNAEVYRQLEQKGFATKHPEIYVLLEKNKP